MFIYKWDKWDGRTDSMMSDIVEAWLWRDPGEIIEGLLRRAERTEQRGEAISVRQKRKTIWDAHYRQARRLHVKQLMRGRG